ncbi:MAG TPA: DivIVA domain-containing protein [Mycobacteriales bacterium]|nr:DivIVA domain-containing protein [Mycobacteriales bacterium]
MNSALTHLATPLTYLVALLIVGGLLFLLASFTFGRGERLTPMPPDVSPVTLPAARPATGRDLRRLRMSVTLRGYRMSEVDWILDQLADQIDERDRELARLRDQAEGPGPADPVDLGEPADRPDDAAGDADPAGRTGGVERGQDNADHGGETTGDPNELADLAAGDEGRHG